MRRGISPLRVAGSACAGVTHTKGVHAATVEAAHVLEARHETWQPEAVGLVDITVDENVADAKRPKVVDDTRGVVRLERPGYAGGLTARVGAVEERVQVHLLVKRVLAPEDLLLDISGDDGVLDEDPGRLIGEPTVFLRRRKQRGGVGGRD